MLTKELLFKTIDKVIEKGVVINDLTDELIFIYKIKLNIQKYSDNSVVVTIDRQAFGSLITLEDFNEIHDKLSAYKEITDTLIKEQIEDSLTKFVEDTTVVEEPIIDTNILTKELIFKAVDKLIATDYFIEYCSENVIGLFNDILTFIKEDSVCKAHVGSAFVELTKEEFQSIYDKVAPIHKKQESVRMEKINKYKLDNLLAFVNNKDIVEPISNFSF